MLLFSVPVWALNYLDEVEKVQCQYWKKLLKLPSSTPGYVIRLETGTSDTTYSIIKCTLRFILRLLEKDDNSFLCQCLKWQLRWAARIGSKSRSWGFALKNLLFDLAGDSTLDLPYVEIKKILPSRISKILERVNLALLNRDTERMAKSNWTPIYAKMKTHAVTEPYLQINLHLPVVQLISQLRVNIFRIIFKDAKIPLQNRSLCPWCNECEGNSDHYISECHCLSIHREKYLSNYVPTTNVSFVDLYNMHRNLPDFFKNIFYFFNDCYKTLEPYGCEPNGPGY
ncbi:hypothetical protein Fcan01_18377 [Folsomia candida]|uniref:Uncharacterized protein n=1 Tax=Folsomia candida TaxID=158441 RepID=A0A226DQ36_FOLCA|nr:hypothetical protein Fcan01_18377 [Folsomia candida]